MHARPFACVLALTGSLLLTAISAGCSDPPDIEQVGGEIYVYELAPEADGTPIRLDGGTQKAMVSALQRRIDPLGTRGVRVSFNQAGQVEIAVPGHDEAQRAEVRKLATSTGRLEFLILANPADHADLIEKAKDAKGKVVKDGDTVVGRWVDAVKQEESGDLTVVVFGDGEVIRDGKSGKLVEFSAEERQQMSGRPHVQNHLLREKGLTDLEVLVVVEEDPELNLQGKHLASISEAVDETARPCLDFSVTDQGAKILATVTSSNLPDRQTGLRRKLGIIFDDRLISAPRIMSTIRDRGRITGDFTREEIQFLVAILQAGELPAPLCKEPAETIVVKPATRETARD